MSESHVRWELASASVRGSMHDTKGLPNQDAVATAMGRDGAHALVAVSDGHGGDRYIRSDTGARLAVEAACSVADDALSASRQSLKKIVGSIPSRVVARWRELVSQDRERRPFDDRERAAFGPSIDQEPDVPYGATLLVALARGDEVGLLQIGDGDIIVGTADGPMAPVPSDARLVGGQTTSLCLPTAVQDFRTAIVRAASQPYLVVVATDGYGNSFADPDWRLAILMDLRERIAGDGMSAVSEHLPEWLAESAAAAGDDVTVAVMSRASSGESGPQAGRRGLLRRR